MQYECPVKYSAHDICWRYDEDIIHIVGRITYWRMSIFWLFREIEIWHVSLSWDILQIPQFVGTEVI